jgi:branched-chain amino acid transport system permease protein
MTKALTLAALGRGAVVTAQRRRRFPVGALARRVIQVAILGVYIWGYTAGSYGFQSTLTLATYMAAFAVAFSVILGYLNLLNFSQHAVIGLGAYGYAIAASRSGSVAVGFLIAAALAVASVMLVAAATIRLQRFPLALVTIAAGSVFATALTEYGSLTGASTGLFGFPMLVTLSPLQTDRGLLIAIIVLVAVSVLVRASVSGRAGRLAVATGDDEFLARNVGASPTVVRVVAGAWCGLLTGLISAMWVQQQQVAVPDSYNLELLLQIFLVLMVGGRRSVWGPIGAAIVVVGIPRWIGGIDGNLLTIIFACLVVVIVVRRPAGLFPEPLKDRAGFRHVWRQRESPRAQPGPSAGQDAAQPRTATRPSTPQVRRIAAEGLTKRFGPVVALDNVSVAFAEGEITGIVGTNGSGKTTLLNCLTGVWRPSAGRIRMWDASGTWTARRATTHALARQGIGRSFQVPRLASGLTPRDNIRVAADASGRQATRAEVDQVIARWNLERWLASPVASLPHGVRRWVELARLDLMGSSVLLLDEPAAGIADDEIQFLADALRQWRDEGKCVVLVEHNHDLIHDVANTTVVMTGGRIVGTGRIAELRLQHELNSVFGRA